jgi:hypothetical protein
MDEIFSGNRHAGSAEGKRPDPAVSKEMMGVGGLTRRVHAVTSHSAEYMQRWCCEPLWRTQTEQICAQLLAAAGRGPARLPTCEYVLRHARIKFHYAARDYDFSSLVVRALSLFAPGELTVLRVRDADVFRLVLSMVSSPSADRGSDASSQAIHFGEALTSILRCGAPGHFD